MYWNFGCENCTEKEYCDACYEESLAKMKILNEACKNYYKNKKLGQLSPSTQISTNNQLSLK